MGQIFVFLAILGAWVITSLAFAGEYDLVIEKKAINVTGQDRLVSMINGSVPGPVLRWREGEDVTIRVTNRLDEPTSIHWHGIMLPANMDGVPGISFGGIVPGATFTYHFPVKQSGTYWYHSHSELQEQTGMYASIIIEPVHREPYRYDREYVVMLGDWSNEDPHTVFAKLKKQSGYYNFQKRTALDFFRDVAEKGWDATVSDRLEWGRMRMDPTDIADVTGYTYTFLITELGVGPGLSEVELGLRLRYEIVREFAPYIGFVWERKVGQTADLARGVGEEFDTPAFMAGVRWWF